MKRLVLYLFLLFHFQLFAQTPRNEKSRLEGYWYQYDSKPTNAWVSSNGRDLFLLMPHVIYKFDSDYIYGKNIPEGGETKLSYSLGGDSILTDPTYFINNAVLKGDTLIGSSPFGTYSFVKVNLEGFASVKRKSFKHLIRKVWEKNYDLIVPSMSETGECLFYKTDEYYFDIDTTNQAFLYDQLRMGGSPSDYFSITKYVNGKDYHFALEYYDNLLFMFTLKTGLVVVEKIEKEVIVAKKILSKHDKVSDLYVFKLQKTR